MADERAAVTKGLMDQKTIQQLSASGDEAKKKRAQLKKGREDKEKAAKEAAEQQKANQSAE